MSDEMKQVDTNFNDKIIESKRMKIYMDNRVCWMSSLAIAIFFGIFLIFFVFAIFFMMPKLSIFGVIFVIIFAVVEIFWIWTCFMCKCTYSYYDPATGVIEFHDFPKKDIRTYDRDMIKKIEHRTIRGTKGGSRVVYVLHFEKDETVQLADVNVPGLFPEIKVTKKNVTYYRLWRS